MTLVRQLNFALVLMLSAASAQSDESVAWFDWEPKAFQSARENNKLIMVNVGHEGCTACRFMKNNTFTNQQVIDELNQNFVSIQVDSEVRPDIGERYSDWAWPATAFMRPDGKQVLALRGSMRPAKFMPILEDLITKHASGALSDDAKEPYVAPNSPNTGPLDELRDQVRGQLGRSYNDEIGGWGSAKVLEYAEPSLQFLLRGYLYNDEQSRNRGLKNAHGFAQQVDPVWGGMFYASFKRWGNTVKELRTESQSSALQLFAAAYQVTDDLLFRQRLELIDQYLRGHMRDPDGLFYASQKDTVLGMVDLDIESYYALSDPQRLAHGLPRTDHSTFTDLNARVLEGYVRAFEATSESRYLDIAIETARALTDRRQTDSGWYLQLIPDEGLRQDKRTHVLRFDERPYLRTQAYVGRALLGLYQVSADEQWLARALEVAVAMREHLEDKAIGGFYASATDGTEAVIPRRKPLEDNAVAAQFLFLLGVATKDNDLKVVAENAVRATAAPAIVKREGRITGNLAMALELMSAGYVEFSVVGDRNDSEAQALLAAGQAVFEPRKVVHYEAPGRYPDRGRPAMYICNDAACSLPIFEPGAVSAEAAKFTPAVFAAQGAGFGLQDPVSVAVPPES
jgi:uncharacterized protein YyaL (SSP411 family)